MISLWWLTLFYSYSNINKGLLCKCLVCTITHTYRRTPYLHQAQCTKCICFYHYHNFHSDITLWNPLFIVNHLQMQPFYYLPINNSRNLLKSHVLKMASGWKCNSQIAPWNGFHSNAVCKGQKISKAIFLASIPPKNQRKNCHNFCPSHTACIWTWMTKRWGATSDDGFIFKRINEN